MHRKIRRLSGLSAQEEFPKQKVPVKLNQGTKITLKPRKAKYLLGENIILDSQISLDGDGVFEPNSTTGLGSDEFTVIATDAAGKQAAASTRIYHTNGSGGRSIRCGEAVAVPLRYYCRLEKPGTYHVRAAHNFNLTEGTGADRKILPILKYDPRWAETTIEVAMPDEVQAKKVVEEMCRLKDVYGDQHSIWDTEDYADFTCLQQRFRPNVKAQSAYTPFSKTSSHRSR